MLSSLTWSANVGGSTRPWRILAWDSLDDGGLPRELIVKHFRRDQAQARAVEYIAGRFAYETGIQAIKPEFVVFSAAFLSDLVSLPEPPRDVHLAEPGVHVAFAWNPRAVCLMGHHTALQSLEDPNQVGEIIGVDTVLINFDRTDQNVLFEPRVDYRRQAAHILHPIDWDQCLAGGDLHPTSLRNQGLIAMRRPWSALPSDPMCARIRSADDFLGAVRKLGGWSGARARLQLMVNGIPQEWDVPRATQKALVDFFLGRIEATIEGLRRPDDPDQAFPNWQGSLSL